MKYFYLYMKMIKQFNTRKIICALVKTNFNCFIARFKGPAQLLIKATQKGNSSRAPLMLYAHTAVETVPD